MKDAILKARAYYRGDWPKELWTADEGRHAHR